MKRAELTPPVQIEVHVAFGPSGARALKALNALHGFPDGVPMDAAVTPGHRAATHQLLTSRVAVINVNAVREDGWIRMSLESEPEDMSAYIARARKEFAGNQDDLRALELAVERGITSERDMLLVLAAMGIPDHGHALWRIMAQVDDDELAAAGMVR